MAHKSPLMLAPAEVSALSTQGRACAPIRTAGIALGNSSYCAVYTSLDAREFAGVCAIRFFGDISIAFT